MDRDDVRPGVLRVVAFRQSIDLVRLKQELKVGKECITTGFFRLGCDDLPALWIAGVRVPLLLPCISVAIADSGCKVRQLVSDECGKIGRADRWTALESLSYFGDRGGHID